MEGFHTPDVMLDGGLSFLNYFDFLFITKIKIYCKENKENNVQ